MTDLMVAAGVAPRQKFTTVYSGMEVEPFIRSAEHRERVRQELGYRPEHIVIGKIARLFKLKGHDDVIRAARHVVNQAPNVRFLFIGDGILRGQLQQQIADAGLTDYFQFTGLMPPERIPELLAATDIVVHASLREGLARVLPQALIAGKPVVSYDVDGAREVVISGETGFLIPPRNIDELADKLTLLAADPTLRDRLGGEGRRRFTDQFRHEHMTAQLRQLYQDILCKAAASGRGRDYAKPRPVVAVDPGRQGRAGGQIVVERNSFRLIGLNGINSVLQDRQPDGRESIQVIHLGCQMEMSHDRIIGQSLRAGHPTSGYGAKRVGKMVARRIAVRETMVRGIRGVGGRSGKACR